MDAYVVTKTASNIGNIVMRDIMRNPSGSLGHGEFIIVIYCVHERSHKFLIPKVGNEPIGKSIC